MADVRPAELTKGHTETFLDQKKKGGLSARVTEGDRLLRASA